MLSTKRLVARFSAQRLAADDKSTRHEGLCGFCGKQQRVQGGKLVLHGYKRPGHGSTEGRCGGVGMKPMEISPETAELAVKYLSERIENCENAIRKLGTDPENSYVSVYEGRKPTLKLLKDVEIAVPTHMQGNPEISVPYVQHRKADLVKSMTSSLKYEISQLQFPLNERKEWVAKWEPRELITFEEAVRRQQEQKLDREKRKYVEKESKYQALKAKLLERVNSSFTKLKADEAKYRKAPNSPLAEKLDTRYDALLETLRGNVYKLRELSPVGLQTPETVVLKDLGIDEILEHLGVASGIPKREYGNGPRGSGSYWKPYWPGFDK